MHLISSGGTVSRVTELLTFYSGVTVHAFSVPLHRLETRTTFFSPLLSHTCQTLSQQLLRHSQDFTSEQSDATDVTLPPAETRGLASKLVPTDPPTLPRHKKNNNQDRHPCLMSRRNNSPSRIYITSSIPGEPHTTLIVLDWKFPIYK